MNSGRKDIFTLLQIITETLQKNTISESVNGEIKRKRNYYIAKQTDMLGNIIKFKYSIFWGSV